MRLLTQEMIDTAKAWIRSCPPGGFTTGRALFDAYATGVEGRGVTALLPRDFYELLREMRVRRLWSSSRNPGFAVCLPEGEESAKQRGQRKAALAEQRAKLGGSIPWDDDSVAVWFSTCCTEGGFSSLLPLYRSYSRHTEEEHKVSRKAFKAQLNKHLPWVWSKARNRGFAVSLL